MPTQLNQVPEALQSDFDIVGDSGFFADPQQLFLDSLVKTLGTSFTPLTMAATG